MKKNTAKGIGKLAKLAPRSKTAVVAAKATKAQQQPAEDKPERHKLTLRISRERYRLLMERRMDEGKGATLALVVENALAYYFQNKHGITY
jgi:hypothetical protein